MSGQNPSDKIHNDHRLIIEEIRKLLTYTSEGLSECQTAWFKYFYPGLL